MFSCILLVRVLVNKDMIVLGIRKFMVVVVFRSILVIHKWLHSWKNHSQNVLWSIDWALLESLVHLEYSSRSKFFKFSNFGVIVPVKLGK